MSIEHLFEYLAIDSAAEFGAPAMVRVDGARTLSAAAARLTHAATLLQVLAAGVVEAEGVHIADHKRSTRFWLARHNGISHRQASALCRAVTTRDRYSQVDDAFRAGEIALGHIDAIAGIIPARFTGEKLERAMEAIRDIQPTLIEAARTHTVDRFGEFCARVRDRLNDDGSPDRAAEPSRVWLTPGFDGRWNLKGDLSADDGALLATILMDADAAHETPGAGSAARRGTPNGRCRTDRFCPQDRLDGCTHGARDAGTPV